MDNEKWEFCVLYFADRDKTPFLADYYNLREQFYDFDTDYYESPYSDQKPEELAAMLKELDAEEKRPHVAFLLCCIYAAGLRGIEVDSGEAMRWAKVAYEKDFIGEFLSDGQTDWNPAKYDAGFEMMLELEGQEDFAAWEKAVESLEAEETPESREMEEVPDISLEKIWFDKDRYLRESADPDVPKAIQMLSEGKFEDAKKLFCEIYERGNLLAGQYLAHICGMGYGVGVDTANYLRLNAECARGGYPVGARNLAHVYRDEKGVWYDRALIQKLTEESFAPVEEMAEAGDVYAQYVCGCAYQELSPAKRLPFLDWLNSAADAGWKPALAEAAFSAIGVEEFWESHADMFDEFAKDKSPQLQHVCGLYYYLTKRADDCVKCWTAAAEKELIASMCFLGSFYEEQGNFLMARKWYRKAARYGDSDAVWKMALRYAAGKEWELAVRQICRIAEIVRKNGKEDDAWRRNIDQLAEIADRRICRMHSDKKCSIEDMLA